MPKAEQVTLALMADAHCGHRLGLLNPETVLTSSDGPWTPGTTKTQDRLWEKVEGLRLKTEKKAGKRGRVVVAHVGDLAQGNAFPHSLVSVEPKDQVEIAAAALRPWLRMRCVSTLRIIVGTDAHTMGEGSMEVLAAQKLATEFPDKSVEVRWHLRATVAGVLVDVAHRGPVAGSRMHLRGNVARFYLRDRMERDFRRYGKVARLYVRAHVHDHLYIEDDLEGVPGGCRAGLVLVPSLCGLSDYARGASLSAPELVVGMVFADLRGGEVLVVRPEVDVLDLRTVEEL